MQLAEWDKLDHEARQKLSLDFETYLSVAQQAACEYFVSGDIYARGVYLQNRFGDLILAIYVDDKIFDGFAPGWGNRHRPFHGFSCVIEPLRHGFDDLFSYEGTYLFTNKQQK